MMTLSEALKLLPAARTVGEARFASVGTDSRKVLPGQLFVALRGEKFDGHHFVEAAVKAGAAAVMVDKRWQASADLPRIVVDDTRLSLGTLAAGWRARFDIPVIGITGSNGKTTVKELCAAILRTHLGYEKVLATQGNFNNDIGLPLTLLGLRANTEAAVIEMGMNHPGEIAYLTQLARPTVALVNNAQRAHLEGMGSLEGVALEKGCIYDGLGESGVAVVNADDAHADQWLKKNQGRNTISFGIESPASVRGRCELNHAGTRLWLDTPWGQTECTLQLPGKHNAANALAAAAACLSAGVPLEVVAAGLAVCAVVHGRLQSKVGPNGCTVLDDTYNANPDSVRAGIDVLARTSGRKILVFGDMGEVGESSAEAHAAIGAYARQHHIDHLYTLGDNSRESSREFGERGQHFEQPEHLVAALVHKPGLHNSDTILVKGSRFMRMERIVDALVDPMKTGGKL